MRKDFFELRKVWGITPFFQAVLIIALFLLMAFQMEILNVRLLFVPIYEEVIFRGLILGFLMGKMSDRGAIIASSALFGLWHLKNFSSMETQALISQVVYTGVILGPILAWIAIKKKTIWPGVIIHYLNNLWSPASFVLLGYVF